MNKLIILIFLLKTFISLCESSNERSSTCDAKDAYPIVNVTQGQLQGLQRTSSTGKTFYSFKGVPFAQPPVDFQRFKDPLPALPWSDIRSAFEDAEMCAQFNTAGEGFLGNEDCLYLNILTPSLPITEDKKHPVLIYIHGGGLAYGSGAEAFFNPTVYLEKDIIVVSIQYRLGIFGFLSLDIPEVPGNAALKDQLMAIKWVNENIEQFNGNSSDITLYGISAGGASVEFQMLNTKSEGLFHKLIMSSSSGMTNWATQRNKTEVLEKLSNVMGVPNQPHEILNNLMVMDTLEVLITIFLANDLELRRSGSVFTQFTAVPELTFPNVDSFMTDFPLDSYKSGNYLRVPTLTTLCRDEGNVFPEVYGEELMNEMFDRKYNEFVKFVNVTDADSFNANLTRLYSSMNISEEVQMHEFISDLMFLSGIHQMVSYFSSETLNASLHYSYLFSFIGNQTIDGYPESAKGTTPHAIDAAYLAGYDDSVLSEEEIRVKYYLASIHTDFIRYGNPTISENIPWDPVNGGQMNVLDIGNNGNYTVVPFPFYDRMMLWSSLFY